MSGEFVGFVRTLHIPMNFQQPGSVRGKETDI